MNQVTYVSSIKNQYKKAKLNNVIQSLNCFVSCTTPDVTQQDYGIICYCGKIAKGQYIKGNKPPKKADTPVIVSNVWLGTIDNNGNLLIENTYSSEASFVTTTQWLGNMSGCPISITMDPNAPSGCSSYYRHDNNIVCGPYVTCTQEEDDEGKYISEVSTTCTWTPYHEYCYIACAFPGQDELENRSACWLLRYWFGDNIACCKGVGTSVCCCKWFNEAYGCYNWCSGRLYYCACYRGAVWFCVETPDYCECTCYCFRGNAEYGPFAGYCCTACGTWVAWEDGHFLLNCPNIARNCPINLRIDYCWRDEEGCHISCCWGTISKTLDANTTYAASSTGNLAICDNPYCCVQFQVCRKLREIEGDVCFCVRYY